MVRQRRQGFNRREKRALARLLLSAFILALLFLTVAPKCSLHRLRQVNKQTETAEKENETLLQATIQLNEEIRLLQHDERYLEKIAREKYGMLKKNEEVYYVSPPPEEKSP
ncbi:FtsB family cell division protein [Candidatus Electronema sp. TJ]|uniref:FtsB family cell division protein n=1 Tax=Candidatus Electronema sp. TJ TaxID=3401573 RepID=UPI003AA86E84